MAVLNAAKVDTTPGNDAVCPFSHPLGWEGDSAAYMVLMRSRYTDLMHGQRMMFSSSFSREGIKVEIIGPYAEEATRIIEAMHNKPKGPQGLGLNFEPSGAKTPEGVMRPQFLERMMKKFCA